MIKKLRLLFTLCVMALACHSSFAQQQIWGTVANGGWYGFGYLYHTDSIGNNLTIVHNFDSIQGRSPGRIMLAVNGKLYGLTYNGGTGEGPVQGGASWQRTIGGTLFEYDIVTQTFKVLLNFDTYNAQFPYSQPDANSGLVEISPGVLYGQFIIGGSVPAPRGYIFKYVIATNTISIAVAVPDFKGGTFNETQHNYVNGPLFKASDGFLYGATPRNSTCPIGSPDLGSIIKINPANNSLTTVYLNPCSAADGMRYNGYYLEDNGNLYSVAGGGLPGALFMSTNGVIYRYNLSTKAYTKMYEFKGDTFGQNPSPMVRGKNGKWYGTADGGTPYYYTTNFPYGSGILYEYDPLTANVVIKREFRLNTYSSSTSRIFPANLMCGYNGKLYGTTGSGLFEYNATTSSFRNAANFITNTGAAPNGIISICEKPVYAPDTTRTYKLCAGTFFQRNLYCTNVNTVVWKHNNVVDATQTTPLLKFASVSNTQAGTWVCELTNDCGTTTIPAFTIVVNAAGGNTVTPAITPAGSNLICPGKSIILHSTATGNWNTGATGTSLTVKVPGDYQLSHSNACGLTYSNVIRVDTIASPEAPTIQFARNNFFNGANMVAGTCPGTGITLTGNTNGVWNTGQTTDSIMVTDTLAHFVITSNQCSSDTSVVAYMSFYKLPKAPAISITVGSALLCEGDSALLSSNDGLAYNWMRSNQYFGTQLSYAGYGSSIAVKETGTYYILINNYCGDLSSDSINIIAHSPRFDTAYITAAGPTTFCEGDSVILHSFNPLCTWSTGDTTQSIAVRSGGLYYVTNTNSCSSKTSDNFFVTVYPVPVIDFQLPAYWACIDADTIKVNIATPTGGTYSGVDLIRDSLFYPPTAGIGVHTFSYSLTNVLGCSATVSLSLYVSALPAAPVITQNGNTLESSMANTYQWYRDNDLINGATEQTYTPTQNGLYKVTIHNFFGCDSTSAPFAYIATKANTLSDAAIISVYPNPTTGNFTVDVPKGAAQIAVINELGQVLQMRIINSTQGETDNYFTLNTDGIYLLKITTGVGVAIKKVTVCR